MLRRFLIGVAVCLVGNVFFWQLFIFNGQIIVQVIIIGMGVFPAIKSDIRSRFFDEVIMMMSMYPMLAYTPWVQDDNIKFHIGYVSILAIVVHLLVKLVPMTIDTIKRVVRRIRLGCKRREQKA